MSLHKVGRSKRNTDEGPVVIGIVGILLLTIHLFHVFICEILTHFRKNESFGTFSWHHDADVEVWGHTKAQHSFDVGSQHLQVNQGRDELLERSIGGLKQSVGCISNFFLKDFAVSIVLLPLILIVTENAGSVAFSAQSFERVVGLIFIYKATPNRVAFFVSQIECDWGIRNDNMRHSVVLLLFEFDDELLFDFFDSVGSPSIKIFGASIFGDINNVILLLNFDRNLALIS